MKKQIDVSGTALEGVSEVVIIEIAGKLARMSEEYDAINLELSRTVGKDRVRELLSRRDKIRDEFREVGDRLVDHR